MSTKPGQLHRLRHEAFVPFLISVADHVPAPYSRESWDTQGALEKITFHLRATKTTEWRAWYAEHAHERRSVWLKNETAVMQQLLSRDEGAALAFFQRAIYRWDDIAILPFVETALIPHAVFGDYIAGWINLTYKPSYRSRLKPLAQKVAKQAALLEPWARQLLVELEFVPGKVPQTWSQYVQSANMAM